MMQRLVGIVLALITGGHAIASDPVPVPKDVPPVLGMAVVSDPGKGDEFREWKIRLTLPKIAWEVVGEVVPKKQWPELKAEVQMATLTLRMGGPSQLAESRVVDVNGKDLDRKDILKRLEKETPVLVSVSGEMIDRYYLQLTKPDAVIIILGPRDGYHAPELLPSAKAKPVQGSEPKRDK